MKRIVHWTAGTYTVGSTEKEHYHFIRDGFGTLHRGDHTVDDNLKTSDGDYAAHTRGRNTAAISYSFACMAGAIESPFNAGKFPMKRSQWDLMIPNLAQLCRFYGILPTSKFLLTHAEVQRTLCIAQLGKWDIARLPFDPPTAVGDKMRADVVAAMNKAARQPHRRAPAPLASEGGCLPVGRRCRGERPSRNNDVGSDRRNYETSGPIRNVVPQNN